MTAIQAVTFLLFGLIALVFDYDEVCYIFCGLSVLCGIVNDIVAVIRINKKGANDDSEAM